MICNNLIKVGRGEKKKTSDTIIFFFFFFFFFQLNYNVVMFCFPSVYFNRFKCCVLRKSIMALKCKPQSPYNFEETLSIKTTADGYNEEPTATAIRTGTNDHNKDDALRARWNREAIKLFLVDNMGLCPQIPSKRVTDDDHSADALQDQRNNAVFKQFLNDDMGLCPLIELKATSKH